MALRQVQAASSSRKIKRDENNQRQVVAYDLGSNERMVLSQPILDANDTLEVPHLDTTVPEMENVSLKIQLQNLFTI